VSEIFDYFEVLMERQRLQYDRALLELTDDQWHYVPEGKGNSIAFIAWHFFRTQDNIVNWVIRYRQPTVWMKGDYAARTGLPPVIQGTGMSVADAHALRVTDTRAFIEYVHAVQDDTAAFLKTWSPSEFNDMITLKPVGDMTKLQLMGRQGFPHGFAHLGEIQHIRTMLGLPGIGL
jgi:hypothetical protein